MELHEFESERKVRYAAVGLGFITQAAALPAFQHAHANSQLAALVSNDPVKLREIGDRYGIPVELRYSYQQYDECLTSGAIDAVYIGLPNNMHSEYTRRAARMGVHVLCEKPMALNERECTEMLHVCEANDVKLMIGYRLHFEEANLRAIEICKSGQIGEPRVFSSVFTQQVPGQNIRLAKDLGGGPVYDIGIYCINAARNLFRAEPESVFAYFGNTGDPRFEQVEEAAAVCLRFPGDRLANFTCSFGAAAADSFEIIGTKGSLRLDPAFEWAEDLKHILSLGNRKHEQVFPKRDQFAAEFLYFSKCILENKQPEPSGEEGLADARVIDAIFQSADEHRPVRLSGFARRFRPSLELEVHEPAPEQTGGLVHAAEPSA
jgi:predicted dehydrogenase